MSDFKFEIIEELGVISEGSKGWQTELNLISWNGNAPKYDVRSWSPDHEKMGKGITLTGKELAELKSILDTLEVEVE